VSQNRAAVHAPAIGQRSTHTVRAIDIGFR
jgi:hypothetical protein